MAKIDYKIYFSMPPENVRADWRTMLSDTRFASLNVAPEFFDDPFIRAHKRFAVLANDGDKCVGIATGTVDDGIVRCGIGVRPHLAIRNGADRESVAAVLFDGVNAVDDEAELIEIFSWDIIKGLNDARHIEMPEMTVMLDLTNGVDAVFKGFAGKRRSDIRRKMKDDSIGIRMATRDDIEKIYDIHLAWCKMKGLPSAALAEYEKMFEIDGRVIFLTELDGEVAAASFFRYYPHGLVEYAANNSYPSQRSSSANDLLVWRAIEWACENGMANFSMGGAHPFLERFGGELLNTHLYRRDKTFLKMHENRERAINLARSAYSLMPAKLKKRLRQNA